MQKKWIRKIAMALTVTMFVLTAGQSHAMLAPATNNATINARQNDIQTVQKFLEQKEVGRHLSEMSLTSTEINSHLGNLSDQELHEVATRIHQQQPGRDGTGAVVTVLVIGILVLLFIYLFKRV